MHLFFAAFKASLFGFAATALLASASAQAGEMRSCHQTCAELLNGNEDCEQACKDKDDHPGVAGYCPGYQACFNRCNDTLPNHANPLWEACRDICVAVHIRYECGLVVQSQAKTNTATSTAKGPAPSPKQRPKVVPQAKAKEILPPPASESSVTLGIQPEAAPSNAQFAKFLAQSYDGKGRIENSKARDPLRPTNALEAVVQDTVAKTPVPAPITPLKKILNQDGPTIFEIVHGKYRVLELEQDQPRE